MGKSDEDTIKEFNELVNMTASELEKWLKVREPVEASLPSLFPSFLLIR